MNIEEHVAEQPSSASGCGRRPRSTACGAATRGRAPRPSCRRRHTTRAYCRIHSYLITIRLNAIPPMQAIRDALAGQAWTPLRALTPA